MPHHRQHGCRHPPDVDRDVIDFRFRQQIHRALCDVHRLIADALDIRVNLQHGHDEAQVDSHGLLHGEQVERKFIDGAFGIVDRVFPFEDELAKLGVALKV